MILALSRVELTLLLRNKTAAALALAMPLLLGGYFALLQPNDWTTVIAMQFVLTLGCTGYLTSTTALVGRRQELYLKRLRTGQASDATVLTGLLLPTAALGCVQTLVLLGISLAAGAPLPDRPLLLLAALLGGFAVSSAVGVFTSTITGTVELAQITTFPFFVSLFAGVMWVLDTPSDALAWYQLVVPGGAVAELVRAAWGGATGQVGPALLVLAAWIAAGAFLSVRYFRWDPRA